MLLLAAAGSFVLLPVVPLTRRSAFDHATHTSATCVGCHAGVETTQRAGFPPPDVCVACHAKAPVTVAAADWQRLQAAGVAFWTPAPTLPAHVLFSHRRHVALAGLTCAACHADIERPTTLLTRVFGQRVDEDTCLACHRAEGANEDCTGCHR